jgi:hypothetical protein
MDFSNFKLNCSDIASIMSDGIANRPLTEKQNEKLDRYISINDSNIPLTENQQEEYDTLLERRNNSSLKHIKLTNGNKEFLKKLYSRIKYNKQPYSTPLNDLPFVMNGVFSENIALKLASEVLNEKYKVHKQQISNDYLKGIIDAYTGRSIKSPKAIIEIKTSKNYEVFLSTIGNTDLINQYYYQCMGYMAITGCKIAKVIFCCVSYDANIIKSEINKYLYKIRGMNIQQEIIDKNIDNIINNMTFDDIPKNERVNQIIVHREDDAIQKMYKKIELSREFLNQFDYEMLNFNL